METAQKTQRSDTYSASPASAAVAPAAATAPAAPAPVPPSASGAASAAAPAPRRSRRAFMILGLVAVLVAAGVLTFNKVTAGQMSTDDAEVAADIVPVGARAAGLIVRVHVAENQRVARGQLLVEIDPADDAARLAEAEAGLAISKAQADAALAQVAIVEATSRGGLVTAQAALAGSTAGVASAAAQVAVARAARARAQSDAHKADTDLVRARELHQANAVPQERLDVAESAADAAHAVLAETEAQVVLAEEARRGAGSRVGEARGRVNQSAPIAPQIASARAGADLAQARVRSAEAALTLARLQLGYTRIVAPADGFASKLMVHEGQLLAVGQPVIQLIPTATYVVANFKETQVGRMRPGQTAAITLDAYPGRTFAGRVESLSGGTGASFSLLPPDNASGNFVKVVERVPVRVAWVNPPEGVDVRAGLSADVTVSVDK